jgi:hypothetical protein
LICSIGCIRSKPIELIKLMKPIKLAYFINSKNS